MTPYARKIIFGALARHTHAAALARNAQTWSTLSNEPRRYPVRPVGDGFVYHKADTHDNVNLFRARQFNRRQP